LRDLLQPERRLEKGYEMSLYRGMNPVVVGKARRVLHYWAGGTCKIGKFRLEADEAYSARKGQKRSKATDFFLRKILLSAWRKRIAVGAWSPDDLTGRRGCRRDLL